MKLKAWAGVILFYLMLVLGSTYPLIGHFTTRVLGSPRSDVHSHLWNFWWLRSALEQTQRFPLRMDAINYPTGGALFATDTLNSLLAAALEHIISPIACFNLLACAELLWAALGAFALAWYLLPQPGSALVSGVIFGFSPLLLSHTMACGILELAQVGWIPWTMLWVLKTIRERSWLNPVLGAGCFFLTFFAYVYCGFFLALALLVFAGYWLWVRGAPEAFTLAGAPSGESLKSSLGRLIVLFALALALTLPVMLVFLNTIKSPDSILPRAIFTLRTHLTEEFGPLREYARDSYLVDYVLSGKHRLCVTTATNEFYHTVYLGWLVLGLAALGLRLKQRFLGFWLWLGGITLIITLGPYVLIAPGLYLKFGLSPVYLLLFKCFPYFSFLLEPFRFALLVNLAAAVLAAAGVYYLSRSWRPPWQILGGMALSLIVWLDFILISPLCWPLPETVLSTPQLYYRLARQQGAGALIELPQWRRGTDLMVREYFYWQTVHQRPIAGVIHGFPPPYLEGNPFTRRLLAFELSNPDRYRVDDRLLSQGFRSLVRDGFRYIVVHQDYYRPEAWAKTRALLARFCPPPQETDPGVWLYTLPDF